MSNRVDVHIPAKKTIVESNFMANTSRSVMKQSSMARVPINARRRNTNPIVYRTWVAMKKAAEKRRLQHAVAQGGC